MSAPQTTAPENADLKTPAGNITQAIQHTGRWKIPWF